MYIEKRVKLGDVNYYIRVELHYEKSTKNNGIPDLKLTNYKNSHYDGGNFSLLLEKLAKNYTSEKAKVYDENISYMADIIYLYDRIPFLVGIKDELRFKRRQYSLCYWIYN